jgi:hypothetical protein
MKFTVGKVASRVSDVSVHECQRHIVGRCMYDA